MVYKVRVLLGDFMNYAAIKYFDIANGPGIRVSLFVSGCKHNCKGCFNKEAQSFDYGEPFTKETEDMIISALKSGLTILGGEPFEIENAKVVGPFLERVKKERPDVSIWVYTGFTWRELQKRTGEEADITQRMLDNVDILVDGRFIERLKSLRLQFRGSSNQRIIDVKETKNKNKIVKWKGMRKDK